MQNLAKGKASPGVARHIWCAAYGVWRWEGHKTANRKSDVAYIVHRVTAERGARIRLGWVTCGRALCSCSGCHLIAQPPYIQRCEDTLHVRFRSEQPCALQGCPDAMLLFLYHDVAACNYSHLSRTNTSMHSYDNDASERRTLDISLT